MNRLRKVIRSTVISLLGQGVTWTSTLILTIAYGRFLGPVKFGELYFAITFVALIGFPIDAGFNQQLTRDVAQQPSKALQYVTNILCFKVVLWVVLYGCALLLCRLLGYSTEVCTLVTICGITLLISSIANLMSALHYAFERVVFPVVGNILEKGLGGLIGVVLLAKGASIQVMALVLLGGACANMLWQSAWLLRLVGIPCTFDIPLARKLLRTSIPFILYGGMAGIALLFNLGLNLLLIPLFQQIGAAIVTSLTELLLMITALMFIPRSLWPIGSVKVGFKSILAGLVMGLVVWFQQEKTLLAILPVAALVYFGTATLLGTIPRDDVRAFCNSIPLFGIEEETPRLALGQDTAVVQREVE